MVTSLRAYLFLNTNCRVRFALRFALTLIRVLRVGVALQVPPAICSPISSAVRSTFNTMPCFNNVLAAFFVAQELGPQLTWAIA